MPNCPECTAREKKKIQAKYEAETPEEERGREDQTKEEKWTTIQWQYQIISIHD